MSDIRFRRKIENFTCQKCQTEVQGNGYTDHCSACLWGKHVDVHPGDRSSDCSGMMEPISAELDHGKNIIMYRCEKCGHSFWVKASKEDNLEEIAKLINK